MVYYNKLHLQVLPIPATHVCTLLTVDPVLVQKKSLTR